MLNKDERLGTEKVSKLFFKLAIPTVLAQIINLLYNIIDRIYIGHIPVVGSDALTGVGVCLPLIMFITAFSSLCGMGGAPKAAIKMGEKKYDDANKILGNCITLAIIIATILTIVFSIFGKDLLLAFGASEKTIPYASEYMAIYCLGTISVMVSMGIVNFITTQGFSKISMVYTITGALLNIILDPLFIFTFNMGVQGAALATVISQTVTAILIISFLLSKKSNLKITLSGMKLKKEFLIPCIALGLAPFIMMSTESVISICFNTSLFKYGGDIAVGSMTILTSLMSFAMMPLQGFTQGAQPIISFNYGAKKPQRCKEAFKVLLKTCIIYAVIFWALIMLFPKIFASLFTTNQELIDFTSWALRIYMAVICLFGIQLACQQTFIALGNAPISLFLALLRKVILLIPLIYIIPLFFENKCFGVFLAEPIADTIAVTTTLIIFIKTFNKTMKKIEPQEENTLA